MVVVAAPHFALAPNGRFPVDAEDVVACPLVSSPDAPWAEWCQAAKVAEPPAEAVVLSANDSNIAIGAVLLGQGIALERRSLVAHALAQGALVQITGIRVPYRYPYWLVWQQREILNARQAHFAQWIEAQVDAYLRGNAPSAMPSRGA
jgi:LysR family glycine cleavage system transcriptional activator